MQGSRQHRQRTSAPNDIRNGSYSLAGDRTATNRQVRGSSSRGITVVHACATEVGSPAYTSIVPTAGIATTALCPRGYGDGPEIQLAMPAGFESPRCRLSRAESPKQKPETLNELMCKKSGTVHMV